MVEPGYRTARHDVNTVLPFTVVESRRWCCYLELLAISVQDRWDLGVAFSGSWMRGYGVLAMTGRKEAVA